MLVMGIIQSLVAMNDRVKDFIWSLCFEEYCDIMNERDSYKDMANYNKAEVERLTIELREMSALKIELVRKEKIIRVLKAQKSTPTPTVPLDEMG